MTTIVILTNVSIIDDVIATKHFDKACLSMVNCVGCVEFQMLNDKLKGKGKGEFGRARARENVCNSLPFPFRTPATRAKLQ